MAAAVAAVHQAGIMHRDIKAENLVFAEAAAVAAAAGRPLSVKLIDLGMAARYDPKDPIRGQRVSVSVPCSRKHTDTCTAKRSPTLCIMCTSWPVSVA